MAITLTNNSIAENSPSGTIIGAIQTDTATQTSSHTTLGNYDSSTFNVTMIESNSSQILTSTVILDNNLYQAISYTLLDTEIKTSSFGVDYYEFTHIFLPPYKNSSQSPPQHQFVWDFPSSYGAKLRVNFYEWYENSSLNSYGYSSYSGWRSIASTNLIDSIPGHYTAFAYDIKLNPSYGSTRNKIYSNSRYRIEVTITLPNTSPKFRVTQSYFAYLNKSSIRNSSVAFTDLNKTNNSLFINSYYIPQYNSSSPNTTRLYAFDTNNYANTLTFNNVMTGQYPTETHYSLVWGFILKETIQSTLTIDPVNNYQDFSITNRNLVSTRSFNYEQETSKLVKINSLINGVTESQLFTVNITDVPDNTAPTNILLSSNTISENNTVNQIIGSFTSIDPDINDGDTFTYSLISGSQYFNINGNNLRASIIFDYEIQNSYTITVRSTDIANNTFDKTFTINVTNVVETPTDLSLSSTYIFENNTVNQIIGTISNNEPDNTITYSIVPNVGDYTAFNINGDKLRASTIFNYELKNSYSVRIRATDITNNVKEETFTISVQNVNESPTNITLSSNTITSGNAINAIIGTLDATDPEGTSLTFSIVSGQGDQYFNVASVNGLWRLRAKSSFDLATTTTYSVTIRATNSNGNFSTQAFNVTVYPLSSSGSIQYTNNNAVTFDSDVVYLSVEVNPLTTVIYYNNLPLPTGSVVVNSLTGQKFIKSSGGSLSYVTVPTQPPTNWKWGNDGAILWELLQSI